MTIEFYYFRCIRIFNLPFRNLAFKGVKSMLSYGDNNYFYVDFSTGMASKMYEHSWRHFYTPQEDMESVKVSEACKLKKWEI